MRFIVLIDKQDKASSNIGNFLRDNHPTISLHYLEKQSIYSENIDKKPELKQYDFFIFATKHSGEKSKILSLHAPGNFKQAELGGKENKVCSTSAFILKTFFQILNKNKRDWQATLEATHHGPYINKPCLFIEIGSNQQDWKSVEAGKAIANTIQESIEVINNSGLKNKEQNFIPAIGIGGLHYCNNFNFIQLNSDYALSHIIPNYQFPITKQMIEEAISKTLEPVKTAILDWKSLNSEQRKQATNLLAQLNLKIIRTSQVEK